jgi:hypothetical protein
MKFIFALLLIFLTTVSCSKTERKIHVTGTINDVVLNQGSGVTIKLKAAKIVSGVYNANYTEIASTTTDASGKFVMDILVDKVSGYRFLISKPDYFEVEKDVTTETFENNDIYETNFDIYPISTITLEVKNTSPQGMDDEINYRFTNINQECKTCCNNNTINGLGPDYNVTSSCNVRGQKMYYITWVVAKNGNQNLYHDSIWVEAFKTANFEIHY